MFKRKKKDNTPEFRVDITFSSPNSVYTEVVYYKTKLNNWERVSGWTTHSSKEAAEKKANEFIDSYKDQKTKEKENSFTYYV